MNLPNLLSFSRIPFLFLIVILLHMPAGSKGATLAFFFFLVAAITDFLDGWVARRFNMITDLGKFMDALTDKILVLGMFVAFLSNRILPAWSLLLILFILTREFLITGLRLIAVRRGVVLAAEKSGKLKMVFQIVSISVLLFTNMMLMDFSGTLPDPWWTYLNDYVGIGAFLAAAALTIFSGSLYLARYGGLMLETRQPEDGPA